jgi:hypothetical protein
MAILHELRDLQRATATTPPLPPPPPPPPSRSLPSLARPGAAAQRRERRRRRIDDAAGGPDAPDATALTELRELQRLALLNPYTHPRQGTKRKDGGKLPTPPPKRYIRNRGQKRKGIFSPHPHSKRWMSNDDLPRTGKTVRRLAEIPPPTPLDDSRMEGAAKRAATDFAEMLLAGGASKKSANYLGDEKDECMW